MIKILGQVNANRLPDVETDRLYLRQRTSADAEDIFAYARLPEVSVPAGFPAVETLADELYYIEHIYPSNLAKENIPSGYGITLKGTDKVIGSIDFPHRHGDKTLEIGYLLHPDYWGQGIVPEAGRAMLKVGFELLGLDKIILICYDYNKQSQAVARKLGFTLETVSEEIQDPAGRTCRDETWGLLREEWER
ncbi:GNAT family N-acetyltransferase [Streptococcus hyointestinalis]|uniref:Acetyltransferase, GNAT family n=1 Tax=Streptococcus hyointestinalis TaxID=1337 RepID=A0A380KDD9_9STRE|nr:GNAT family protein [Streptococcus hyointestinalis]SUN62619.1 acetyltransferase, GNAT family [Streptococcus hyointestinalis]